MKRPRFVGIGICIFQLAVAAVAAWGAETGALRVGAARVDITPAADAGLALYGFAGRKTGFAGIHDPIYVRALVLDDGNTQAALIAWELGDVPDGVWAELTQRIASELKIRPENVLLSAIHDHSAPGLVGDDDQPVKDDPAYTRIVEDLAVEAVRTAQARLQPAKFGIGTGTAYVNINRREPASNGRLALGYNENGPSDKTVTVLRFDDLAGKPIAFYINYAVHAVVMSAANLQVTGDLPGATSRFVEQHYLGKDRPRSDAGPRMRTPRGEAVSPEVVALWSSGAAGDQNPVSMENGQDFGLVAALGQILGEAVVRVADGVQTSPHAELRGAQQVVTCPGKQLGQQTGSGFIDADPVNIRLSLLMIDHVALAGVSGEVFTAISQRLKKESPFSQTVMVTHANGCVDYIPNDAAYEQNSYEINSSRLKPGCAEGAIVNGVLDMMRH